MGVPIKEIANKNTFSTTLAISNSKELNNISKNVYINDPRERSYTLSLNLSRESLAHSSISSILYAERIEIQNNNPTWARQIEIKIFNLFM